MLSEQLSLPGLCSLLPAATSLQPASPPPAVRAGAWLCTQGARSWQLTLPARVGARVGEGRGVFTPYASPLMRKCASAV